MLKNTQERLAVRGSQLAQPSFFATLNRLLRLSFDRPSVLGELKQPDPTVVRIGAAVDVSELLQIVEDGDDACLVGADPAVWETSAVIDAVAADPAGSYGAAACELLAAVAKDEALTQLFALPDFGQGAMFPFEQAIGFHFIDYVVHGWDVTRAVGLPFELPDNVIDAALALGLKVPGGDYRAGASARPAVRCKGSGRHTRCRGNRSNALR